MKITSRLVLFGALALVLLSAACAGQQGSPTATAQATSTAAATDTPTVAVSPTETTTSTPNMTLTPGIPITGLTVSLICQFCVDNRAHALLIMPAAATFTMLMPTASVSTATATDTGCTNVETTGDKQIVLCRAPSNTSITLNICADNNCQQFRIQLQTCPPLPTNTATLVPTVTRTPTLTLVPSTTSTLPSTAVSPTTPAATATTAPTSTPIAGSPTPTFTPTFTPTP